MQVKNIRTKLKECPQCHGKSGAYIKTGFVAGFDGKPNFVSLEYRELMCNTAGCEQKFEIRGGWLVLAKPKDGSKDPRAQSNGALKVER